MPNRPPKKWMRDCVDGVRRSGSAVNPGAVCGSLWYHKMSPAQKRKAMRGEKMKRRRRHRRANPVALATYAPLVNPVSSDAQVAIGVFAAAGLGLLLYWFVNRYTLTVAPGNQSLKAPPGTTFTLRLPNGAQWQSLAAGAPASMPVAALLQGSGPQTMTSANGEMVLASWVDSRGTTQTSTITITS